MTFLDRLVEASLSSVKRAAVKAATSVLDDAKDGLDAVKSDLQHESTPRKVAIDVEVAQKKDD